MPQQGAYIDGVKPSHLTWRTILGILTDTEAMTVANAMIRALLVAQLRRFRLLSLGRLWGVASCTPRRYGVEKTAWRSHLTLPVDRPEEVEARQCEKGVVSIGTSPKEGQWVCKTSMIWLSGESYVRMTYLILASPASPAPAAVLVGDISATNDLRILHSLPDSTLYTSQEVGGF